MIVPSMSYENLDVKDGAESQVAWNVMIRLPDGGEKSKLIEALEEYCGQDTLGIVEIQKILNKSVKSRSTIK